MRALAVVPAVVLGVALTALVAPLASRTDQRASRGPETAMSYVHDVETWRSEREQSLLAPDGWLGVNGLYWLAEGRNSFGTAESNDIVLPPGSAPAQLGAFRLERGRVHLEPLDATGLAVNGQPATARELALDGRADQITVHDLTMFVMRRSDVERGDRFAIRLRDPNSPMRKAFKGLEWWPVDEAHRLTARFIPYAPTKPLMILNIVGDVNETPSPGALEFTLGGQTYRVDTYFETPTEDDLFVIFKDRTNGETTYGAGRYLRAPFPGGRRAADAYLDRAARGERVEPLDVVLDFNRAYSPPCAFTPYATCPLPPKQNWLPVAVEAGERYRDAH